MTREFTVRAGGNVAPDGEAIDSADDTDTDTDTDGAADADRTDAEAADTEARLDALESDLRSLEKNAFGSPAMAAEVWDALDSVEVKKTVMERRTDRLAEAIDSDGAAEAGRDAADANQAGTVQSAPRGTGGDPSGYGSDVFTDGGAPERPSTVLAALDAEDAAEDPLNGETLPGVFATLEARRRAVQDGARALDRRAGAIDADAEQGYTGSHRTGANYAGSTTGQDHARPQPDGYPTGGVFARLRAEERDA